MKSINTRRMNFIVKQPIIKQVHLMVIAVAAIILAFPMMQMKSTESIPVAAVEPAVVAAVEPVVVAAVEPVVVAAVEPVVVPFIVGQSPTVSVPAKSDLESVFKKYKITGLESFEREKNTNALKLTLSSDTFFQSGTATLKEDSLLPLNEIVEVIKSDSSKVMIEVEGHTDDSPIVKQKKLYQSNWELSTARATSMIHAFEGAGFNKEVLKVVGYGDSRPMLPNRTPSGEVITSNLVKNRRIIVRVFQTGSAQQSL